MMMIYWNGLWSQSNQKYETTDHAKRQKSVDELVPFRELSLLSYSLSYRLKTGVNSVDTTCLGATFMDCSSLKRTGKGHRLYDPSDVQRV